MYILSHYCIINSLTVEQTTYQEVLLLLACLEATVTELARRVDELKVDLLHVPPLEVCQQ